MTDAHTEDDLKAAPEGFEDIETPEELLPHAVAPVQDPAPRLDRPRPERAPLVPRWVYTAVIVIAAVVIVGIAISALLATTGQVTVPDVTGIQLGVAESRLAQDGLGAVVTEHRFSVAAKDEVLEQSPAPGAVLKEGEKVRLVVSAGTEEFLMPDVVGDGLALARGTLESRGLAIIVEPVPSDQPSDTVLGSVPSPGVVVRTGDTVRLSVASGRVGNSGVQPYMLSSLTIVLDPAPVPEGTPDATLDVARRLRALLEASGASVYMTRSGVDTASTDATRAERAGEATVTLAIGLSIERVGSGGRIVTHPSLGNPDIITGSGRLASALTSALAVAVAPATSTVVPTDTVLGASRAGWARVSMGSAVARGDATSFADTNWLDQVARAIYSAIGSIYGVKEQL